MGRHARGVAHSRLPMAKVMLGVLIVLGLAVASLVVFRAQPASRPAAVAGSAVVVASLACPDGTGGNGGSAGTIVDLQDPLARPTAPMVRASLDACGYREGQQVAVEYVPGDPTHVTLAGSGGSIEGGNANGTRLLPFGIVIAALLAVGAALAVFLDGRRAGRHGRGQRTAAHSRIDNEDAGAGGIAWFPRRAGAIPSVPAHADDHHRADDHLPAQDGAAQPNTTGDGGRDSVGHGPLSVVTVLPAPTYPVADERSYADRNSGPDQRAPQLSSIDLIFPSSGNLAASLHDELFTHRSTVG